MAAPWAVPGSRGLCRTLVNRDFKRARRLLEISPTLINIRHPLGWAPLHAAILCGDPSLVKFVLDLPILDITIKDCSTFNATSLATDILCRQQELCSNICATENTSGATALHFACMRGDVEILNLLLKTPVAYDVRDDSQRLPHEYFDLDRVDLEAFEAYRSASKAWCKRWRSIATKDITTLCGAIRDGDDEYCKEILESKPELARDKHPSILEALQVAVADRKPADINILLPSSSTSGNLDSGWPQIEKRVSTPLHYSCLVGNMRIAEILLRNGAEWTISDSNDLLPEDYAALNGDSQMQEFKRLCEKEAAIRAEEEELRLAARVAEELKLKREQEKQELERLQKRELEAQKEAEEKKLREEEELRKRQAEVEKEAKKKKLREEEESREREAEIRKEAERQKKRQEEEKSRKRRIEEEKELERKRKLQQEEELRKRHLQIERIIGNKIIGQRGPIRSVASAIRLRENGWVDPDRPLVMLFLGSSGIGKTELAKQVAHYLHGDKIKDKIKDKSSCGQSLTEIEQSGAFVRIDMSEYQHDYTVSNLTGSPKGYVGYEEGGVLTNKLKQNPDAIVLLDEIEKAHPDVLTVFLQVFDDGRITDPKLGTICCKGAVFIMTSNLGSEEIRAESPKLHKLVAKTEGRHQQYLKGIGQFNKRLYPILKGALKRDEFLGRINQTVVFLPLSDQEIGQIVEIELKKWKKRAEEHHAIRMSWSRKVVDRLIQGYDVNYGARSVINEVQTLAVQVLAESQIRGDIRKNWLVHLFINDASSIDMAKEDPIGRIPQRGCHYVF
ncbi:unnamed protein product [Cyclocybe aegerita]|uniref:AAA+ ATPase domain-containing protein n=1 Tax=Cyclocybe aegerita TaxID=1973307 RepID=A0A8S0W0Q0_CYCAE|nr:unnamed protein product [Cyclocybe aegerita]